MKLFLATDGGSRGNPGPAATGYVITDEHGLTLARGGSFLGNQTNNYAEYKAFIEALTVAEELGGTQLNCISDSKLVVEQLNRNWKVKEPSIKLLAAEAWQLMDTFANVTITHVLREDNTAADAEVNAVLDTL